MLGLLSADAETVTMALAADRADLVNPPVSAEQYLDTLTRGGLAMTAAALRAHVDKF